MADFKELVFTDDFRAYRKKQLLSAVELINGLLKEEMSVSAAGRLHGAIEMAVRLIRLPGELIGDESLAEQIDQMLQEDLIGLTTFLVRRKFNPAEE